MTRKDYEMIAQAVKQTRSDSICGSDFVDCHTRIVLDKFVRNVTKQLKKDNPRFDENKFIRFCEFNGG